MLYISGSTGRPAGGLRAPCCAPRSRKEIPRGRLDEAVARVLSVKRDYGLIR